ncbi:MAG: hypothetical protein ABEJ86_06220 [Halococcoides sp.]
MTGWPCPECGVEDICSRREFREVYNYRAVVRENPRAFVRRLEAYGVAVRPGESAEDAAIRWVEKGVEGGPELICAYCATPFSRQEVGR